MIVYVFDFISLALNVNKCLFFTDNSLYL
ncbi:unnamed protein product [Cuscuta epithymum]|uniref:Uncharacterized protein n=1 Tax=Cuscuta epithymum TaxID=186058 RepID=A0AAV0DJ53_9ASTE|nr:unnamed protein product [Cuscuta epithymum]